MRTRFTVATVLVCLTSPIPLAATRPLQAAEIAVNPHAPAEFLITNQVLRPREKVPPLGANNWGACGAIEWAANNFVRNSGNEPVYWRNMHRAKKCGSNWFEIDGPGTSWWDLWTSGLFSGANLRIYRLVDKAGNPLPEKDGYLDLQQADHVQFVGRAQVIPEGSPNFPDGGWIANTYCNPFPNAWIRHGNLSVTDAAALENGRTYWYTVVAVGADNQESDHANEAAATPKAGADTPPHLLIVGDGDKVPELQAGSGIDFAPAYSAASRPIGGRCSMPAADRSSCPPASRSTPPRAESPARRKPRCRNCACSCA